MKTINNLNQTQEILNELEVAINKTTFDDEKVATLMEKISLLRNILYSKENEIHNKVIFCGEKAQEYLDKMDTLEPDIEFVGISDYIVQRAREEFKI